MLFVEDTYELDLQVTFLLRCMVLFPLESSCSLGARYISD